MGHSSFEVKSSTSFYEMLKAQFEEFKKDDTSSKNAILTSILAYHLREWLWKEHEEIIKNILGVHDQSEFNAYTNRRFYGFPIIREICNGSKHFNTNSEAVQSSGLRGGAFSPTAFTPAFNIGVLTINDGTSSIKAINLLEGVLEFYEELINKLGISKRDNRLRDGV
jgi:hypothetical protein